MQPPIVVRQFARVVVVVIAALAVALALSRSRRGVGTPVLSPATRSKAHIPVGELARCRSVRAGQTELPGSCCRISAEYRDLFFVSLEHSRQTGQGAPRAMTLATDRRDCALPNDAWHPGER